MSGLDGSMDGVFLRLVTMGDNPTSAASTVDGSIHLNVCVIKKCMDTPLKGGKTCGLHAWLGL